MKDLGAGASANNKYVLVTAAYNEEAFIEKTIVSIVSQTLLPVKWVIVSDGSTDRTDEIVREYADRHEFISLLRLEDRHALSFASKVNALNSGFAQLTTVEYGFMGILDADVFVEPFYYRTLLDRFNRDPELGLAGGLVYDQHQGRSEARVGNSIRSVAGAIQLFRRECHEVLGGFLPLEYGGEDWWAETKVRMNGWRVEAFPDLIVLHHRATGTAGGLIRYWYRQGLMDFSLGSHPLFEIFKLVRRLPATPFILGALSRLTGFVFACCRGGRRPVPEEFVTFLRNEQKGRMIEWLRSTL